MLKWEHGDVRCQACLAEYNFEAVRRLGIAHCPHCRTSLPPMWIREDGYIHVNWQELRVLAIYAQRWGSKFDLSKKGNQDAIRAFGNILRHLERFKPQGANPLTIKDDPIIEGHVVEQDVGRYDDLQLDPNADLKPGPDGKIKAPYRFKKP